jgi:ABC-type branched-subunit amino acid transport system ATPase component
MLKLESVSKSFGGVRALDQLDLSVERGELVGLIGPNGSGKTTTVNLITGLFPVTSGSIIANGNDITSLPTHRRVSGGISRTFQNIRLFPQLSVWENLWVAYAKHAHGSIWRRLFGDRNRDKEALCAMLEFVDLADKSNHLAGDLAFGEQRRLELARAMATEPKILLLDEPAAGMTIQEIADLERRLFQLRELGMTILLIEHHMALVMRVCDRITVLNFGKRIATGLPREIQVNPLVQEAYLGSVEQAHA